MPRMACPKCKKFLHPKKNGVWVEEGMPRGDNVLGVDEKGVEWGSYKLFPADLWQCPGCGVEIIAGFPNWPAAEHYQEHYQEFRQLLIDAGKLHTFVMDCL